MGDLVKMRLVISSSLAILAFLVFLQEIDSRTLEDDDVKEIRELSSQLFVGRPSELARSLSRHARSASDSCRPTMDLIFVLDSSTSVSTTDFITMRDFVHDLVSGLDVAQDGTRVATILYGKIPSVKFYFNDHWEKADVLQTINSIPAQHLGLTNTGGALTMARVQVMVPDKGSRLSNSTVPQVLILMTDGKANYGVEPAVEATNLKRIGSTIITVGINIGSITDAVTELKAIASANEYVFVLDSFVQLKTSSLLSNLTAITCSANTSGTRPPMWGAWSSWTTCSKSCGGGQRTRERQCISTDANVNVTLANCTQTPGDHVESENCNTLVCVSKECTRALDLVFLLDSSGYVSRTDFQAQINFTKTLISFFGVSATLSQVSVVKFGETASTQFYFRDYPTDLSIHNAISALSTTTSGKRDITGAMRFVRRNVLLHDRGARVNDTSVPQLVILVTAGLQTATTIGPTLEASDLKHMGSRILSVGVGTETPAFSELLVALSGGSDNTITAPSFTALNLASTINSATGKICHSAPKDPHYYFSAWSSWSSCSASCGPGGATTRSRTCMCASSASALHCGGSSSAVSSKCKDTDLATDRKFCYIGLCPPAAPIFLSNCPLGNVFSWVAYSGFSYSLYVNGSVMSTSCNTTGLDSCLVASLASNTSYYCRLRMCNGFSCAWSSYVHFRTTIVSYTVVGQTFNEWSDVSVTSAAGLSLQAKASSGLSCLVRLDVSSSAIAEAEALGGSLRYVCYMLHANGTVVASSTLQANNITHLQTDLLSNSTYTMKLFVVYNDNWFEVDLRNTTLNSTDTVTTRHQYAPEALGPVSVSQDGTTVHIKWSVRKATHLYASDGLRYRIWRNNILLFDSQFCQCNLSYSIANASTAYDVYKATVCNAIDCVEGMIDIRNKPPEAPVFHITIRGTVLEWQKMHYTSFTLYFNGTTIPACNNITGQLCVASSLQPYTKYRVLLRACYITLCTMSPAIVIETGHPIITTSIIASGSSPLLKLWTLPYPPVLEAEAIGAGSIRCRIDAGATLTNTLGTGSEVGFDKARYIIFVVINGTVKTQVELEKDKASVVEGLDAKTEYTIEAFVVINKVWYLIKGDKTVHASATTVVTTLSTNFPTVTSEPTIIRNEITQQVSVSWTVTELISFSSQVRFFVFRDDKSLQNFTGSHNLSLFDTPGAGFHSYRVTVCYSTSTCVNSLQQITNPEQPETVHTPVGTLVNWNRTSTCSCKSTVLLNGTVVPSCKDIEGSVCLVPLTELGLDMAKSHVLEAVIRECDDKHGCSESPISLVYTEPVTPGEDGRPTHKIFVTGGIIYSQQSTTFNAGGSTTSSYGIITGSTYYAGGSTSLSSSTNVAGVAQNTVILGGSVLQVGGSVLNRSLPIIQVNKTIVDITDEALRDILHFGVPPLQVGPSGPTSISAVLTTKIVNGRCACYMEDANGNLAIGLEKSTFYVFVVHAVNESVVTYASVSPGKVTNLTDLVPNTNYKVKYYIHYSTVWYEVTSETSVTTAGIGGGGLPTPTPTPGGAAQPGIFSTPKEGAPSGVTPPIVVRDPSNPNMVQVKVVIPVAKKPTPATTVAPTSTTPVPGATTPPTTVTTAQVTPTEEPHVYTVTRNGIAVFNGTSTGGELSFTSPFPNENDLIGDVFQLKLCNSKGCVTSPIAVTPPKDSVPGRTGSGISPDEPLPTAPPVPTYEFSPHGLVIFWNTVVKNTYTVLLDGVIIPSCQNIITSECCLSDPQPNIVYKFDVWACTKRGCTSSNPLTLTTPTSPAVITPIVINTFVSFTPPTITTTTGVTTTQENVEISGKLPDNNANNLPGSIIRYGGYVIKVSEKDIYQPGGNTTDLSPTIKAAGSPILDDLFKHGVPEILMNPSSSTSIDVSFKSEMNSTESSKLSYFVFFHRNLTMSMTTVTGKGPSVPTNNEVKSFAITPTNTTRCKGLSPDTKYDIDFYINYKTTVKNTWFRVKLPDAGTTPEGGTTAVEGYTPGSGFTPEGRGQLKTPKPGAPVEVPAPALTRPNVTQDKVVIVCTIPSEPTMPTEGSELPGVPSISPTATSAPKPTTAPGQKKKEPTYTVYRDGEEICNGTGPGEVVIEDCCIHNSEAIYQTVVCYYTASGESTCTSSSTAVSPPKTPTTARQTSGDSQRQESCTTNGLKGTDWATMALVFAAALAAIILAALFFICCRKKERKELLLDETNSIPDEQESETAGNSRWMSYQNAAGQQVKRMSQATHAMHMMSSDSKDALRPPSYESPTSEKPGSGRRNSWLSQPDGKQ